MHGHLHSSHRIVRAALFATLMIGLLLLESVATVVTAAPASEETVLRQSSGSGTVRNPRRRQRNSTLDDSTSNVMSTFASGGITSCTDNSIYEPSNNRGIFSSGYEPGRYVLGFLGDLFRDDNVITFWVVADDNGRVHIPASDALQILDDERELYGVMLLGARQRDDGRWNWFARGMCGSLFNRLTGSELFALYDSYFDDPTTSPEGGGGIGDSSILDSIERIPDSVVLPNVPTQPPPVNNSGSGFNYSLAANYGSVSLTSGFSPDPYSVGVASGGSVGASYLGGSCVGFATAAPDFEVSYTSGSFSLLRFYVVGNGDTTLIVNTAGGQWLCSDDSYGSFNPTIDISNPSSGTYDIWVGSYSSGTNHSATLYITEVSSNHP